MRLNELGRTARSTALLVAAVGLVTASTAAAQEVETTPDGGASVKAGPATVAYEPTRPGDEDTPPRGGAIIVDDGTGHGDHEHPTEPCFPTEEERAAADALVQATAAALRKYENDPAMLVADGYRIPFTGTAPPGRYYHLFADEFVYDRSTEDAVAHAAGGPDNSQPTILDPERIESLMVAMTDDGLVPLGGMYMMPAEHNESQGDLLLPKAPTKGPEIGGCLTKWHDHPDLGRMTNRSGAPTPEMLHVWTYPGLDPFGEYDARDLAHLWTAGNMIPTIQAPSPVGVVAGLIPPAPLALLDGDL